LDSAVSTLRKIQHISVSYCLNYLREQEQAFCIMNVFHDLFPLEYRKAINTGAHPTIEKLAEHVQDKFVNLIETRYFPIESWDLEWLRDRFPYIPVQLINYDCESEFEDASLPIRIAAAWVGHYSYAPTWQEIQTELGGQISLPPCFVMPQHHCTVTAQAFKKHCAQHAYPVSGFPEVLDILNHATGSIFLDISYDYESQPDCSYQWNKRALNELTRQWHHAQVLLQSMHATCNSLVEDPSAWQTIFTCWSDLCTAPQEAQT